MTQNDDDLDASLAHALGPEADDTAPLSRAVLNRLSETRTRPRLELGEVLVAPIPAAGLMVGLLALTVALSYALTPVDLDEVSALAHLLAAGF